ncbi:hypothetical protein RIN65_13225 [Pantoea agglomerans]|nr:hypothetical protein [Pantoea agglomerans]WNN33506.1 hypothetical protein RIN65_13225 [Pantoea agglomerans]
MTLEVANQAGMTGRDEKRHKKTRREKDQRAPQFGDFKEKQWHLL